ncbi:Dolichyl-phosphate-mannose-protein mannosyltransferase [Dysgonomonas macrotermitis]|uniref:Dolichyl-phosphate-mannose-protein mannosyltransferase n=2 Tax=Dysgonomonas macrotermitis TaxID=1346286 RepID=A0A1M5ICE6_9BACT|nr:Dolichyl-phosphate-mannose-protein mannosyltransferase [Dysgonomonas macrotermitis]
MIAQGYELHRDEFLHLDQAHHLAWGFVSIPPFTSWTSLLIYHLGNSIFWIKFFPALYGALTILIAWKTIETLKGSLFACILGATSCLLSAYLRINTLYQPNSFEILSWAFLFYCIVRYISSEKDKWLYWFAIGLAFAFLNKYNVMFLTIGIFIAVLLTKHRNIFKNKTIYIAACISLVIVSPNLIWQISNGLPVITHMKELSSSQLVNVDRISFLKEQFLFFLPSFFVVISGIAGLFLHKPFRQYRLIVYTYILTICLFLFFKGKPYYALGLYPVLIAFGAVYIDNLTGQKWRKLVYPVLISFIVGISILYIPLICPIFSPEKIENDPEITGLYQKSGQLRWEDGKEHHIPQDYADMLGWKDLTKKTLQAWATFDPQQQMKTLILCDNYGHAGAINYYSNRAIEATSINADYADWFPGKEKTIENIIQVGGKISDKSYHYFDTIYESGSVENRLSREYGTPIFILKRAKLPINGESLKQILLNKD